MLILWLVTQKKDMKRQKQRLEALRREAEEEQARARAAARERVLQEFEKGQLGLSGSASIVAGAGGEPTEGTPRFSRNSGSSSLVQAVG
jgi:nitric oxide synthase-interacting protein